MHLRTWFSYLLPYPDGGAAPIAAELDRARAYVSTRDNELRMKLSFQMISLLNDLEDRLDFDVEYGPNLLRVYSAGKDHDPYHAAKYARMYIGAYFPTAKHSFRWVGIGDEPVHGGFFVITSDTLLEYSLDVMQGNAMDHVRDKQALGDTGEG